MDFLEKDLENIIWESSNEQLSERGLDISGKRFRQLRIGNYGVADLVTLERLYDVDYINQRTTNDGKRLLITVYELKKDKIGISAFLQAVGYLKGISRYINKRKIFKHSNIEYRIILIGKSVDDTGNFIYLPDLFQSDIDDDINFCHYQRPTSVNFITYSYRIDGIIFSDISDYSLINEGF